MEFEVDAYDCEGSKIDPKFCEICESIKNIIIGKDADYWYCPNGCGIKPKDLYEEH